MKNKLYSQEKTGGRCGSEGACEREKDEERMRRIEMWSQVHPRGGHSACGFYVEIESLTAFVFWKFLRE